MRLARFILIGAAVLNCLTPCLVIAAVLSVTKPIFTGYLRGEGGSKKGKEILANIIESGFGGGRGYNDSSKGDLIAVVALYEKFESECKNLSISEQRKFCALNALDFSVLKDVKVLKNAFSEQVSGAGGGVEEDENTSHCQPTLIILLFHSIRIRTFFARRSFGTLGSWRRASRMIEMRAWLAPVL